MYRFIDYFEVGGQIDLKRKCGIILEMDLLL
jgi:hypothetical protein